MEKKEAAVISGRWVRLCLVLGVGVMMTAVFFSILAPAGAELGDDVVYLDDLMSTVSVAWGDVDGDGDLDIAVGSLMYTRTGNVYGPGTVKVFTNDNGVFRQAPFWEPSHENRAWEVAWGDVDGDGDLDLAVANAGLPNRVYLNDGGLLQADTPWESNDADPTRAVAWGDVNGDGYLDLAVANEGAANKVYLNINGVLAADAAWTSNDLNYSRDIAWGDFEGDGDLDLAVANMGNLADLGEPNKVYTNVNGTLDTLTPWTSGDQDRTWSIAWGDMDGDGDQDLAAGNLRNFPAGPPTGGEEKVYLNDGGLQIINPWVSSSSDDTFVVKWGDVDNDGDLDLATGNGRQPSVVYRNVNGTLETTGFWSSTELAEYVYDLAWGDLDGDHDLELALPIGGEEGEYIEGNQPTKVQINDPNLLANRPPGLLEDGLSVVFDAAWGDVDGDGDLDLATAVVGDDNRVYENVDGVLQTASPWLSLDNDNTRAVAWGDVDGDGDLDLAAANDFQPNKVYFNVNGVLQTANPWVSGDADPTLDVAWGDVDGDGDLDLAVANIGQNKVYFNEGGLQAADPWLSGDTDPSRGVAWGDMDGDGDLELAVANDLAPNKVYFNEGGILQTDDPWQSDDASSSYGLAWGDVDGDGYPELAVANNGELNKMYWNEGGMLRPSSPWFSDDTNKTYDVAWGDVDADGDLDLAAANVPIWNGTQWSGGGYKLYLNENEILRTDNAWVGSTAVFRAAAWGDVDLDGDLDLALAGSHTPDFGQINPTTIYVNSSHSRTVALNNPPTIHVTRPGSTDLADAFAVSEILADTLIPISYTLFDAEGDDVGWIKAFYSLDGGDNWQPAVAAAGTITTGLATAVDGVTHLYQWDTFASGFFGQSDNVVLRFEAYGQPKPASTPGTYLYTNSLPGPFHYPYASADTFPFRVRSTLVQVFTDTIAAGNELAQAQVYRLPAGAEIGAQPMADSGGRPYLTNGSGYLQGRGQLDVGDQLVALYPVTGTAHFTLYHTSAAPTVDGLDMFTVSQPGVQQLAVSPDNSLILFNLIVSLEWDARQDPTFLAQLENDLRRASEILYDISNGQAALGKVRIFHQKGYWGYADLVILANNSQRPSAVLGGSVLTLTNDIDVDGNTIENAYFPGQIRMGPTWNRFGNPGGTLGEDWPRTLAHELGHYLFFMPDNYLGLTEDGLLTLIDCPNSIMSDPYVYSELLTAVEWSGPCLQTLAEIYFGRADWETVATFYPMLDAVTINEGPNALPLAVTQIETFAPITPTDTLADPFFRLVDTDGQPLSLLSGKGQAYLIKTGQNSDPTDDAIIFQGAPVGNLIQARGVSAGDRLCVFDFTQSPFALGCQDNIGSLPAPITVQPVPGWEPQIAVAPVSTDTVIITVTNALNINDMQVQLLPALGAASAEMAMTSQGNGIFVQMVTAPDGAYYGHVRIWVPGSDPRQELIVDYVAIQDLSNDNVWGGPSLGWGGPALAWGGPALGWGGPSLAWGTQVFAWGAPMMSTDGQVSVFPLQDLFGLGQRFALQKLPLLPDLPSWLFPVGQAYRFETGDENVEAAIIFRYLADNVPGGQEAGLRIYFSPDEGQTWQQLETEIDEYRNHATTQVAGTGIYILISTIEIPPFSQGWNTFGYPIQHTQPITDALASIAGSYTSVYHYDPSLPDPWQIHDVTVVAPFYTAVNDLHYLEYGHAYWLYATEPITLYLGPDVGVEPQRMVLPQTVSLPPATYYGWVTPAPGFSPAAGMPVQAWVGDELCGSTTVQQWGAGTQLYYVIHVEAEDITGANACGAPGKTVTLKVGVWTVARDLEWETSQAHFLPLEGLAQSQVYLPLIARRP